MTDSPVDFFGRPLLRGHKIVYSVKSGSSSVTPILAEIHDIVVNPNGDFVLKLKRIREGKLKIGRYDWQDPNRISRLYKYENCIIVPSDSE